jgi:hypothetical protein
MTNDAREPMLQFFVYDRTSTETTEVTALFAGLAKVIADTLPRNPERTVALRKLMEARDCALRAKTFKADG